MASIDADVVKHALKVAREHGFAEVELANGEAQFRASLEPGSKPKKPAPPSLEDSTIVPESESLAIRANHVGYLRLDSQRLHPGVIVAKGDPVSSIATLGLANDIESTVDGEVVEVLVGDGDPVQFGQVIAWVKS